MYNACYGGFTFSTAAEEEYKRRSPESAQKLHLYEFPRHDPVMVQIVREMGEAASGPYSKINLAPIPAEYKDHYGIHEYDGLESVFLKKNAYQLSLVRSLLADQTLSEADKLARIADVVGQEAAPESDDDSIED